MIFIQNIYAKKKTVDAQTMTSKHVMFHSHYNRAHKYLNYFIIDDRHNFLCLVATFFFLFAFQCYGSLQSKQLFFLLLMRLHT